MRAAVVYAIFIAISLGCAAGKSNRSSPPPPKPPSPPAPPKLLGTAAVDLISISLSGDKNVSTSGESNLADLYCQALIGTAAPKTLTICIINGGAFRGNIPAGSITTATLKTVYPWPDKKVVFKISGNMLLALLQYGVTAYPTGEWFPQVGNIRYSFLPTPSFTSSTGFSASLINAQLLNGTTVYGIGGDGLDVTLITNSYLAMGNQGYAVLDTAQLVSTSNETINDVVGMYISAQEGAVGGPTDGRILDCALQTGDSFCTAQNSNGNTNSNGGGGGTSSSALSMYSTSSCGVWMTMNFGVMAVTAALFNLI